MEKIIEKARFELSILGMFYRTVIGASQPIIFSTKYFTILGTIIFPFLQVQKSKLQTSIFYKIGP